MRHPDETGLVVSCRITVKVKVIARNSLGVTNDTQVRGRFQRWRGGLTSRGIRRAGLSVGLGQLVVVWSGGLIVLAG